MITVQDLVVVVCVGEGPILKRRFVKESKCSSTTYSKAKRLVSFNATRIRITFNLLVGVFNNYFGFRKEVSNYIDFKENH